MNRIEESLHLRGVFRQLGGDVAGKLTLVTRIREVAAQQNAVDLIRLCDRAIEDGDVSEQFQTWIIDAYAMIDAGAVDRDKQNRKAQSMKAAKPRGKGDDGRTLGDLIETLAKNHPEENPGEVWPHLKSEIEDWAGDCLEKKIGAKVFYQYTLAERQKTISLKHFSERLRKFKNTV
jgi:hypothetical protein